MLLVVHAHEVVELLLEGSLEVLVALEILHLAGRGADAFAGLPHDAVVHSDIQHLGDDEHAQGVDTRPSGQVQIQAARQRVVPGLLQRHALVHQALDIALVRAFFIRGSGVPSWTRRVMVKWGVRTSLAASRTR